MEWNVHVFLQGDWTPHRADFEKLVICSSIALNAPWIVWVDKFFKSVWDFTHGGNSQESCQVAYVTDGQNKANPDPYEREHLLRCIFW